MPYLCLSLVNIDLDLFALFHPTNLTVDVFMGFFFAVESACEEEKDKARDQDPGEPARRDQHYSTSGHG